MRKTLKEDKAFDVALQELVGIGEMEEYEGRILIKSYINWPCSLKEKINILQSYWELRESIKSWKIQFRKWSGNFLGRKKNLDGNPITFPNGACDKESTCQCWRCKRCRFYPWVGRIPWRRKWHPTPAVLNGKFHGQRSLVGYSPWGHRELDTTERLSTSHWPIAILATMTTV